MVININVSNTRKTIESLWDLTYDYDNSMKRINLQKEYLYKFYDNDEYYIPFMKKLDSLYNDLILFKNNITNYYEYIDKYLVSYDKLNSSYEQMLKHLLLK